MGLLGAILAHVGFTPVLGQGGGGPNSPPGGPNSPPGGPNSPPGGPNSPPGGPNSPPGGPTSTPGGPNSSPGGPNSSPGGDDTYTTTTMLHTTDFPTTTYPPGKSSGGPGGPSSPHPSMGPTTPGPPVRGIFMSHKKLQQREAKEYCSNYGAELYEPKSVEQLEQVQQMALPYKEYWVGVKRTDPSQE